MPGSHLTSDRQRSADSIVGHVGRVVREVVPENISGKVAIGGVEWSARSVAGVLPAGTEVVVVRSEGVHVIVEEVR
jgi:membrane protein implicated in regulation of membrane protease activity